MDKLDLKTFWLKLRSGEFLAILEFLIRIKFFDYLTEPKTIIEIAEKFGFKEKKVEAIINYLGSLGFLSIAGKRVSLTKFSLDHLVSSSKSYLGIYVLWRIKSLDNWRSNLENVLNGSMATVHGAVQYTDFADSEMSALEGITLGCGLIHPSKELADSFNDLVGTLLDVGCGTGVWGYLLAQNNNELNVISLDINPNIAKTFLNNNYNEISPRVKILQKDMFSEVLPIADTVLFANVLVDWEDEKAEALIRKAIIETKCKKIIICEFVTDDDAITAGYDLMVNFETRGNVRDVEWWERILKDYFTEVSFKKLSFGSYIISCT